VKNTRTQGPGEVCIAPPLWGTPPRRETGDTDGAGAKRKRCGPRRMPGRDAAKPSMWILRCMRPQACNPCQAERKGFELQIGAAGPNDHQPPSGARGHSGGSRGASRKPSSFPWHCPHDRACASRSMAGVLDAPLLRLYIQTLCV